MSGFRVVIPARYASQRLPGKPLLAMAGRPMVQWVWERAMSSGANEVLIATDHDDIATACRRFGAEVCLTDEAHASGTDRIAEVAVRRDWADDDIVVNVQGDEPLLPPALVRQVAELLQLHPDADIGTLATPIHTLEEYLDPNVVKVVSRADGAALYFSRAPVPWHRDGAPHGPASQERHAGAMRHVGLYSYRVSALHRLAGAGHCAVEKIERLEQLRALWLGMRIQVDGALEVPPAGVDTAADAARVSRLLGDRSPAG
ncbi:3-deoxy-manno-octulosonate cytidylyltransferase [Wenzhouxiangella sp. XN24]|uniref:3-deoxy-manno-octulosonate cytidylyltransferase n=1 Tax=Wenzhouxiangella sp. XN24 TaxID=2713569 RepID=UPI003211E6F7